MRAPERPAPALVHPPDQCTGTIDSDDKTVGDADASSRFWTGTNGSRCSSCSGALGCSFASGGHLVVTFGGKVVRP